ncbi:hypothetical protein B0I72DRAFT_135986 [Yarrowia lipolytica]|uniref:YALI0B05544p n=2 Tax=Yarrowia lipolytica TaxID=4952 RepID=Q6CFM8_YARLI|nr:YALI0B05544p [Yarrowia lipolytica CLIB122]QNP97310.1 Hypothetical protein YALI2_C00963g [Yarrowia lipolytica]RDW26884.1 hypothetical protein B0I71DRAFT_130147 [Yarrowia lipolytica]RDW33666.1 hypothetical protein B0I72DRAFT_135986 [Yarrowia lipolytica]RDW39538.1 hypothetical protein B0I73DRAFT_131826 [Yarrowia lipolytica]RDW46808.1 hypothetical protein B0I74DRAFT_136425 [Yarrowia lipolytica]|eukprot:XP_500534.1 YALI0B05544p [Yarrowia lipolytica CLIB122]
MLKPTYIEPAPYKLEELTIDHNVPHFRQSSKSYNPHPQQLEFRGNSFVSLLRALDGRTLAETPKSSPCVSPEVESYFAPLVVKKQRRDRVVTAFDTLESSESNGMSPPMVNSTSPITPESSGLHSTIPGSTPFVAGKKPILERVSVSSGGLPVGKLFMADIWQDQDPETPDVVNVLVMDSGSPAVATASPGKTVSPSDALDMMIKCGGRDARLYQDSAATAGMTTTTPKRHRDQWKAKWSDTKRHSKDFFKKAKRGRGGAALNRSDYSESVSSLMEETNNSSGGARARFSGASGGSGASGVSGASQASSTSAATSSVACSDKEEANGPIGINFTDFSGAYSYQDMVTASEGTPRACHSDHFGSLEEDLEDGGEAELTSSYEHLFEKESLRTKFYKVFKKGT